MALPRTGRRIVSVFLLLSAFGAHQANAAIPVLSDVKLLEAVGVPILARDRKIGVAYAEISQEQAHRISEKAHEWKRCGGYEALPQSLRNKSGELAQLFGDLRDQEKANEKFLNKQGHKRIGLSRDARITSAVAEVSEANLEQSVRWLGTFPTRLHSSREGNAPIVALKARLEEMARGAQFPVEISLIDHRRTPQKSVRARIVGAQRPSEIVALGGHIDSINHREGRGSVAPGADDNASGSSNLIEAFRIMLTQPQPQRTVEFFWYAGEEAGLLGSAEIAKQYKRERKDVIGVLQLDMTLHPGSGEFVLGQMTDFTSAWLRSLFTEMNDLYIGARIAESRCGYGCSDHASWHRQGFPTLMPFEASFDDMNGHIHTRDDVINAQSSFRHSAMFAKIAVAFAMGLGNSNLRASR